MDKISTTYDLIAKIGEATQDFTFFASVKSILPARLFALIDRYQRAGEYQKAKAIWELTELIVRLEDIEVNTSIELLLQAREIDREYTSLLISDAEEGLVLQKKYISLPDEHYQDGIILIQDHAIYSPIYHLSAGDLVRKRVPRRVHL